MAGRKNTLATFMERVDENGPTPGHMMHLGQCWLWMGSRDRKGYGQIRAFGRSMRAHRASWMFFIGPIPLNTPCVLHRCDNPACVRPDHLWVGTNLDNVRDREAKGRSSREFVALMRTQEGIARLPRGENHPRAKLTEDHVRAIRQSHAGGLSPVRIAAEYGVTDRAVHLVVSRRTWKHVT